jgi:hypothetical protein
MIAAGPPSGFFGEGRERRNLDAHGGICTPIERMTLMVPP